MPEYIFDAKGNLKRTNTNRENKTEYERNRKQVLREEADCWLCGEPVDFTIKWPEPMSKTIDHVIAYASGGTHERSNLRLAHNICNQRRGNKDADLVKVTKHSREW